MVRATTHVAHADNNSPSVACRSYQRLLVAPEPAMRDSLRSGCEPGQVQITLRLNRAAL